MTTQLTSNNSAFELEVTETQTDITCLVTVRKSAHLNVLVFMQGLTGFLQAITIPSDHIPVQEKKRKRVFKQRQQVTREQVLAIRKKFANKESTLKELAIEYNMSDTGIRNIVNRTNWAWLNDDGTTKNTV